MTLTHTTLTELAKTPIARRTLAEAAADVAAVIAEHPFGPGELSDAAIDHVEDARGRELELIANAIDLDPRLWSDDPEDAHTHGTSAEAATAREVILDAAQS